MADCNDCSQYLSPEDIIRRSVVCSGGHVAALATNLNQDEEAPDGSILTEDGLNYLLTEDGLFYIEQETEA